MKSHVRDVEKSDLKALTEIRNTPDQHNKYLRESKTAKTRFLIYIHEGKKIGFGTDFILKMEDILRKQNKEKVYVGVDYEENKRALNLYRRLGYEEIQNKPYKKEGIYYSTETGKPYKKVYWRIDLVKDILFSPSY